MKKYGIVLLPDAATEALIQALACKVSLNEIVFGDTAHVHLSLLHVMLTAKQAASVKKMLRDMKLPKAPLLESYGILREKSGWQFVEVHKTSALLKLQQAMLPLTKVRADDTDFSWRDSATNLQKRAHVRYGYPNVGSAWQSHFTFSRTRGLVRRTTKMLSKKGHAVSIALVQIGKNGVAEKILYQRPFLT
jgi:hypothetical protein